MRLARCKNSISQCVTQWDGTDCYVAGGLGLNAGRTLLDAIALKLAEAARVNDAIQVRMAALAGPAIWLKCIVAVGDLIDNIAPSGVIGTAGPVHNRSRAAWGHLEAVVGGGGDGTGGARAHGARDAPHCLLPLADEEGRRGSLSVTGVDQCFCFQRDIALGPRGGQTYRVFLPQPRNFASVSGRP